MFFLGSIGLLHLAEAMLSTCMSAITCMHAERVVESSILRAAFGAQDDTAQQQQQQQQQPGRLWSDRKGRGANPDEGARSELS